MKELYKLMAIFFVGVISLVSCTDESDFFEPEKEIETVTFKLLIAVQRMMKKNCTIYISMYLIATII